MKTLLLILALSLPTALKPVKLVVTIYDDGPKEREVLLQKRDGSVFFINATGKADINVEVEMGSRAKHCWTPNLEVKKNGNIGTREPLEPNDFALLCFPETGKYDVQVTSPRFSKTVTINVKEEES